MRAILLLSPLLLANCATSAVLQTAQPLGQGNLELAAEPGAYGIGAPGDGYVIPHLGLSARYGVSDRLDVGGRLHGGGLQATAKYALRPPGDGVALALAPALGFGGLPDEGVASLTAQVPLLAGIPLGEHELVLGAQAHAWSFRDGADGFGHMISPGASLGFAARAGDRLTLLPEASMIWGLASDMGGAGWALGWANAPMFQGAIGVQLRP